MLHYTNLYNVNVTIYKLIVSIYKLMLHFNKMYVCCYIWRRQNVTAEIRLDLYFKCYTKIVSFQISFKRFKCTFAT